MSQNTTTTTPMQDIAETLEVGDYFPFLKIALSNGTHFDLMNCVSSLPLTFVTVKELSLLKEHAGLLKSLHRATVLIIVYQNVEGPITELNGLRLTNSSEIASLLSISESPTVYLLTPNRKIAKISTLNDPTSDLLKESESLKEFNANIPYLLIENVLSEELLDRVIKFYHDQEAKTLHNTVNKNRLHVHGDASLETALDNKLSRSVFPEIKKIYNFEVKYRENYKICSYDSDSNGRFSSHRDTPHPYGNRRYAMSLCLNDEYEGGEFKLNEYGLCVKMKKNTAIIFPGICSHEVNPITSGSRRVIITFFTTKEQPHYKTKSNFFDNKTLTYSQIYPI